MATARATLAAAGLKFENATGRMSDRDGVIERFIDESQFVPLKTEDEVMTWEFSRKIASAANRLRMALTAREPQRTGLIEAASRPKEHQGMKSAISFTLHLKDIKVRRSLPSAVVVTRPHRNLMRHNRRASISAGRDME